MNQKKYFIAGALCPQCGQRDKIVMLTGDIEQIVCECVCCDYRAVMVRAVQKAEDKGQKSDENGHSGSLVENDVQVIHWQSQETGEIS